MFKHVMQVVALAQAQKIKICMEGCLCLSKKHGDTNTHKNMQVVALVQAQKVKICRHGRLSLSV